MRRETKNWSAGPRISVAFLALFPSFHHGLPRAERRRGAVSQCRSQIANREFTTRWRPSPDAHMRSRTRRQAAPPSPGTAHDNGDHDYTAESGNGARQRRPWLGRAPRWRHLGSCLLANYDQLFLGPRNFYLVHFLSKLIIYVVFHTSISLYSYNHVFLLI
jgi:hypothetical protein